MKNKGYTIMEAVIAMFLVVVMVGAVFSALMSARRAIVASSEREEVLYSLQSAYGMLKDCRSNPGCHLKDLSCNYVYPGSSKNLKDCDDLFTFNFKNLCKNETPARFHYDVKDLPEESEPTAYLSVTPGVCVNKPVLLKDYYILNIDAQCTEAL